MKVETIELKIIKDSRNFDCIEACIVVEGKRYHASYPGGTSVSSFEMKEIDPRKAMNNFKKIEKFLLGEHTQKSFDSILVKHLGKLRPSLTTPVSFAFFSANYKEKNIFPNILGNVFEGGAHGKDSINIQEILVTPKEDSFTKHLETLRKIWKEIGLSIEGNNKMSLEAAWTAKISNEKALEIVSNVAKKYNARIGVDIAASEFYNNGKYLWDDKKLNRKEYIENIIHLVNNFKLFYVEDPVDQRDGKGYKKIKDSCKTLVSGDDLIATNLKRLKKNRKNLSAVIVKPNQSGVLSGCLDVIEYANKHQITPAVSHRSRTTKNTVLAKLAMHTPLAKIGIGGYARYRLDELKNMWNSCKTHKMAKI
ncbi:MAG: hypothetical protein HY831_02535 [Candidatus Aenigmarchaeota archaeon]|nr:hypothetical protein [Candidatus Aenigmarchaeota archaeon]